MRFEDQNAIVTGAGRNIGEETAKLFATTLLAAACAAACGVFAPAAGAATIGGFGAHPAHYDPGNPATRGWTYEAFWTPIQYIRIGAQYTAYSRYNGASTNYDGLGRNARDNNSLFLYVWAAY